MAREDGELLKERPLHRLRKVDELALSRLEKSELLLPGSQRTGRHVSTAHSSELGTVGLDLGKRSTRFLAFPSFQLRNRLRRQPVLEGREKELVPVPVRRLELLKELDSGSVRRDAGHRVGCGHDFIMKCAAIRTRLAPNGPELSDPQAFSFSAEILGMGLECSVCCHDFEPPAERWAGSGALERDLIRPLVSSQSLASS